MSTVGGADAVRLINGHLVSARKPPILPNAFRKSVPLHKSHIYTCKLSSSYSHRNAHSLPLQWASSTATKTNID